MNLVDKNFKFYLNDNHHYDDVNVALAVFKLEKTNETDEEFEVIEVELNEMNKVEIINLLNKELVLAKLNEVSEVNVDINKVCFQVSNDDDEIQIAFDFQY